MTLSAPDLTSAPPPATVSAVRWGQAGHVFELRTSDEAVAGRAGVVFRPWTSGAAVPPVTTSWTLARAADGNGWLAATRPGEAVTIRGDARRVVTAIEFRAVRALIEGAPDVLTFHAALVAREGRGLLILGPNEAGKSTLACHLWRAGFSLLGDDVAIVDPASREACSAPRRVSLRASSRGLVGETLWTRIVAAPSSEGTTEGRLFHPDEVDGRPRPGSIRLAACVFLARKGASVPPAGTARIAAAPAIFALLPYSNLIRRLDAGAVIDRVAPLAAAVPVFDVGRGPLPHMIAAIDRLLAGDA